MIRPSEATQRPGAGAPGPSGGLPEGQVASQKAVALIAVNYVTVPRGEAGIMAPRGDVRSNLRPSQVGCAAIRVGGVTVGRRSRQARVLDPLSTIPA
jgi:hypothetical protein